MSCAPSFPNWPSASGSIFPAKRKNGTVRQLPPPAFPPFRPHIIFRRSPMQLHNPGADIFVPDGSECHAALAGTTHLCIAAHQDDIKIMAYHGIAECFGRRDRAFTGVVVTNGAGSSRTG